MYSLKEAWIIMLGSLPIEGWDGKIYCNETNAAITYRTNKTQGYMAAYTFTLVVEGWLTMVYNGHKLTLHPDDLYIYSPGLPITVLEVSDDYHGICLLADEHVTIENPAVRDLTQIAYQPIVRLHEPKLSLPHETAVHLYEKMLEITNYLHSNHVYKSEILRLLYAVFLLDIQNAQEKALVQREVSQRVEDIFIAFIRILPKYFKEHHNIGFYASQLNISSVYLSKVVKQVAGRTVVDYINQMLLMEATFLLNKSSMTISQIADHLHFADTPSFSKFFSRMKGYTPKECRERGE